MEMSLNKIWLCAFLPLVVAKRPFTFTISEVSCRYGEPMSQLRCSLETIDNQTVLNSFFVFSQDVKAFQLTATADVPRLGGKSMRIFDFTVNGCDTLNTSSNSNILKIALTHMRKSGHVPERCPMRANEHFGLTRYALDADILPLYTPELSYIFEFRGTIGSNIFARVVAKGSVEMKRKRVL